MNRRAFLKSVAALVAARALRVKNLEGGIQAVGHRRSAWLDSGFVLVPYVPLWVTPAMNSKCGGGGRIRRK